MENQFEDSSEGSLQLEDFAAIEDLVHRKAGRPRSENKKSKDELKKQRQENRDKGRERIARERPPVPLKFASYRAFNWESGMKPKKKNDDAAWPSITTRISSYAIARRRTSARRSRRRARSVD